MLYYRNNETDGIGIFQVAPGEGWSELSQEELDAYLLEQAKTSKVNELLSDFGVYEYGGCVYGENTYCIKQSGIDNIVTVVDGLDPEDPNAYTFHDTDGTAHDFGDQTGWDAFKKAMRTERNRIMVYYIEKKDEINSCVTIKEVEAIIIDFSE